MKIAKTRDVKTPERGTSKSAGLDFFIPNDFNETMVFPRGDILIPSGIKVKIPKGYMLMANDKSGICSKSKLKVGAKIVDEDYQGEIHLHLFNYGQRNITVSPGMKIVQFILVPVYYATVEVVEEKDLFPELSDRGARGFGSTGN